MRRVRHLKPRCHGGIILGPPDAEARAKSHGQQSGTDGGTGAHPCTRGTLGTNQVKPNWEGTCSWVTTLTEIRDCPLVPSGHHDVGGQNRPPLLSPPAAMTRCHLQGGGLPSTGVRQVTGQVELVHSRSGGTLGPQALTEMGAGPYMSLREQAVDFGTNQSPAGRVFALHKAVAGSIPSIPYHLLSTVPGAIPELRARRRC